MTLLSQGHASDARAPFGAGDPAPSTGTGMRLPLPRRKAPYFKAQAVIGMDFKTVSLDDYRGKWLVLFFYPFDFTFVCPTEVSGKLCAAFFLIDTGVFGGAQTWGRP